MLCSFFDFLDKQARSDVLETVDWIVSLQLTNGNIPSKMEDHDVNRGENELVHWCHGAAGAVHLMIVAYLRTHNDKYVNVSAKCVLCCLELNIQYYVCLDGSCASCLALCFASSHRREMTSLSSISSEFFKVSMDVE